MFDKKTLYWWIAILLPMFSTLTVSQSAWSEIKRSVLLSDPLPVHNLYPPMLRFYEPLPSSALRPYSESTSVELLQSYSSIFQYDFLPDGDLLTDMELYTLELKLRRAILPTTEISLLLPLHYAHKGFMDSFLRRFHETFGFPNAGREFRPDDEFAYYYQGEGGWSGYEGWEVGRLATSLRHQLFTSEFTSAALLGGLGLPTASIGHGWDTGKPDIAIGGVVSWLSGDWFGHFEGNLIHPFAEGGGSTRYRDYLRLSSTLGYQYRSVWSFMVQLQGGNSPYETGLKQLDDSPWLIIFGGRRVLGNGSSLVFAFTEGLTRRMTNDFTLTVGVELNL